jgi:hypothetical protein
LEKTVFVLDSDPSHGKNEMVNETILRINALCFPTYTPMLNPVELM